jgi:hypothetical protein
MFEPLPLARATSGLVLTAGRPPGILRNARGAAPYRGTACLARTPAAIVVTEFTLTGGAIHSWSLGMVGNDHGLVGPPGARTSRLEGGQAERSSGRHPREGLYAGPLGLSRTSPASLARAGTLGRFSRSRQFPFLAEGPSAQAGVAMMAIRRKNSCLSTGPVFLR